MEGVDEMLKLLEASQVSMEVNVIDKTGERVCSVEIHPQNRTIRIREAKVLKLLRNVKLIKLFLKARNLMKNGSAGRYTIKIESSLLKDIFSSKPARKNR